MPVNQEPQTTLNQDKHLIKNRVVIITGASSGIGKALAEQLAASGCRVYALARSLMDDFSGQQEDGGCLCSAPLDVTDAVAANKMVGRIMQHEQRVDVLIQAAGYGLAGSVEATEAFDAASQIQTNFTGSCTLLPSVLAVMRRQKAGLVVQLGSVAGFLPIPFQAIYSASKAAVAALMMALANEVKPYGIRCMLVQPGDTRTGFTAARVCSPADEYLPYADRARRSIARMSADEEKGMAAEKMASLIIRRINRRKPPLVYTPGLLYKTAALLRKLLPMRLVNAILYRMYAA
jgi:short-subunit dehydrogenase